MALTNAQRQKRWREKQKLTNAEKYLKSERDRKRAAYKPHALMSPAELRDERRKDRLKFRRRQERKKKTTEITPVSSHQT